MEQAFQCLAFPPQPTGHRNTQRYGGANHQSCSTPPLSKKKTFPHRETGCSHTVCVKEIRLGRQCHVLLILWMLGTVLEDIAVSQRDLRPLPRVAGWHERDGDQRGKSTLWTIAPWAASGGKPSEWLAQGLPCWPGWPPNCVASYSVASGMCCAYNTLPTMTPHAPSVLSGSWER